jgi:hypothetical protein
MDLFRREIKYDFETRLQSKDESKFHWLLYGSLQDSQALERESLNVGWHSWRKLLNGSWSKA